MPETVAIRARRIVTPDGERTGVLRLRAGAIEAIDDGPAGAADQVVEVPDDCVVLPGLVDSHVHVNEPGRTHWEGFTTATAAAAAGGITTIADMPLNSVPATVDPAALAVKRAAAQSKLAVDVAFWGGAVPGNVDELRALHELGVVGFKCFLLPSGVQEFPPLDPPGLLAAMTAIASFGGLLIAHAEDAAVLAAAPAPAGRSFAAYLASRPDSAETSAVGALLSATRATGCRTHVVHVSSARSLPLLAAAKAEGLPVTAETCPHYLALSAETVPDGATAYKCCPPIRDAGTREALWRGLVDGTLDCVVSDHSPSPPSLKHPDTGDFGAAWGGIASLQLSLPVVWTAARERGRALTDVCRWMAQAPADITRLGDRGALRPGARADLVVFAPDERFVVDPASLAHRHPLTPYAGFELSGVVRQTWLGGRRVVDGERRGQLVDARRVAAEVAA